MTLNTIKLLSAFVLLCMPLCLCSELFGQGPATTTVQDTVYRPDGTLASGSVVVSWPSFISADKKPVFGGTKTVPLNNGLLNIALVPTAGATPPGITYDVKYYQSGTASVEQTWVVPSSSQPVSLGQVLVTSAPIASSTTVNSNQVVGTAIVASPSSPQVISAPATPGAVPLQLKGSAAAAANVLEVYNSATTPALTSYFDKNGALNATAASEAENSTDPAFPLTWPIQIANSGMSHYERAWHQNRTQTYASFDSLGFLVTEQFALNGGSNALANGYNNKTTWNPFSFYLSKWTPGQSYGLQLTQQNYSLGDTLGILASSTCYGGANAPGDEGCEAVDQWAQQGTDVYAGTISSGGGTGSAALTISPSAGAGTQGAGRFLIDTASSKTYSTGTISAISGSGPVTYTGSGTTWSASSVYTTLGTNVTAPGVATVTPGSMTGISNGTALVIADPANIEVVIAGSVTGSTFTAAFTKAHLSTAIVSSGKCNNSSTLDMVELTADRQAPVSQTLRWAWPVIGCTSATSMKVWIASSAGWAGYNGAWTASADSYVLYPAAEVTAVNNGGASVSNTLTLGPNTAPWANTDSVELPHYPAMIFSSGAEVLTKFYPSPNNSFSVGRSTALSGLWTNTDFGWFMSNYTPLSNYKSNGGAFYPPQAGLYLNGAWASGLKMQYAPSSTYDAGPFGSGFAIWLGCTGTANNNCSDTAGIISKIYDTGGDEDTLTYSEPTNTWRLTSAGGGGNYLSLSPTLLATGGNFTVAGTLTGGNGLIGPFLQSPPNADLVLTSGTSNYGVILESAGTQYARFSSGQSEVGNGFLYAFSSDSTPYGTADTAIGRTAAGVLEVDNGTLGTYRDLQVRTLKTSGLLATYNGIATVGNGAPAEYGTVDLTAQGANISTTTAYAVPFSGAGMYRVSVYIIVTRAATSSSTLPSVTIGWTDKDNSTSQTNALVPTNMGNSLTTYGTTELVVMSKASSNITFATGSYASSGATPMQYALHIKVEAM